MKPGSVNCMFHHVIFKNGYYQSILQVIIRSVTKCDYHTININLVTTVFFLVYKLHILVCKSCVDHVINMEICQWSEKMMVYHWCKFQVCSISRTKKNDRRALCAPPPMTTKILKSLWLMGLRSLWVLA